MPTILYALICLSIFLVQLVISEQQQDDIVDKHRSKYYGNHCRNVCLAVHSTKTKDSDSPLGFLSFRNGNVYMVQGVYSASLLRANDQDELSRSQQQLRVPMHSEDSDHHNFAQQTMQRGSEQTWQLDNSEAKLFSSDSRLEEDRILLCLETRTEIKAVYGYYASSETPRLNCRQIRLISQCLDDQISAPPGLIAPPSSGFSKLQMERMLSLYPGFSKAATSDARNLAEGEPEKPP